MNNGYISLYENSSMNNPEKYHNLQVYQIAEAHIPPDGIIEEHIQVCDEITYVLSGSAVIYNNDIAVSVKAGDIHIACKGQKHKIQADNNGSFRYICFGIRINPESKEYSVLEKIFLNGIIPEVKASDDIGVLAGLLIDEIYSKNAFDKNMTEMLILQILILIYRKHILKIEDNKKTQESFSGKTIYEIFRYIDKNFMLIKNIEAVSKELSYSKFYISHIFKEKTGMTVMEYITRLKIEKACKLLKENSMSIGEIAQFLGYESSQSFSKMFKNNIGVSPSEYKKLK